MPRSADMAICEDDRVERWRSTTALASSTAISHQPLLASVRVRSTTLDRPSPGAAAAVDEKDRSEKGRAAVCASSSFARTLREREREEARAQNTARRRLTSLGSVLFCSRCERRFFLFFYYFYFSNFPTLSVKGAAAPRPNPFENKKKKKNVPSSISACGRGTASFLLAQTPDEMKFGSRANHSDQSKSVSFDTWYRRLSGRNLCRSKIYAQLCPSRPSDWLKMCPRSHAAAAFAIENENRALTAALRHAKRGVPRRSAAGLLFDLKCCT